jgi:hypothetical protein
MRHDRLAMVARLEAKKVNLRVLSMSSTQSLGHEPTGRLVLAVIGAVGQAEREATFAQRVRHDRHVRVLGRKWLADGQPVCCSIGRRSYVVSTGI